MNKSEAYKTLIDELEKLSSKGIEETISALEERSEYTLSGKTGKLYSIVLKLSGNTLQGSISELNSFKFDLLEESVRVDN